MLLKIILILAIYRFYYVSTHPLARECLNIYPDTKLAGISPQRTTYVTELVDCHRFCRLQAFDECSTYVYNDENGMCQVFNEEEASSSTYVNSLAGFTTIGLMPDCFDENIRAQRHRRAHDMLQDAPSGGYSGGATQWTQWTQWSACTALCGGGNSTRSRTCPTAGQCSGAAAENKACNLQSCCTAWTKWSPCSVTCGRGTQKRTQRCMVEDHSVPTGYASKETPNFQNCTGAKPECASWSNWAPWTECTATCGGGQQTRSRTCSPSGAGCVGAPSESQACNSNKCPEWSSWTDWTQCSDTCGGGWQIRTRNCSVPDACPGDPKEKQLCNVQACPNWGEWQEWGACDKDCGGGTQTRNRPCINDEDFCVGENATNPICICEGAGTLCHEDRPCNNDSCASWTDWSPWTPCSDSCGGGWQIRTRNCTQENMCTGDAKEKQLCNVQACPYWGPWEEWQACDKECGQGNQTRTRACVTDDSFCVGTNATDASCTCVTATEKSAEIQACNLQPCAGGGG